MIKIRPPHLHNISPISRKMTFMLKQGQHSIYLVFNFSIYQATALISSLSQMQYFNRWRYRYFLSRRVYFHWEWYEMVFKDNSHYPDMLDHLSTAHFFCANFFIKKPAFRWISFFMNWQLYNQSKCRSYIFQFTKILRTVWISNKCH